jgi:hypothetical protein
MFPEAGTMQIIENYVPVKKEEFVTLWKIYLYLNRNDIDI